MTVAGVINQYGSITERLDKMNTRKLFVAVLLLALVGISYDVQAANKPAPERFIKADTNQDGKLSQAEFAAAFPGGKAEKRFATADADKDGFVTPEELKAARGKKPEKPAKK